MVIVTPDYLASTPRVVKEADALAEAGLRVAVVYSEGPLEAQRGWDREIERARPWTGRPIRWSSSGSGLERLRHLWSGLRARVARRLERRLGTFGLAALAACRVAPELALAAALRPARLYIGHYPGGLVAAATAAALRGGLLGYDAEDLHTAEPDSNRGAGHQARSRRIEARLLPRCASITASSVPIGEALAREFDVAPPLVVHNAFPWRERASMDGRRVDRVDDRPSATWFSQTVGLDRGLEGAIAALGRTRLPWELHLRGRCSDDVRARLRAVAAKAGVVDRLHLHEPVPPGELLSRVAEHDVGLALEQPDIPSSDVACANKVFTYLLAGLPVVATATRGQTSVLGGVGGAARFVATGSSPAIATALDDLAQDLAAARASALESARTRWCWEIESRPHVERVRRLLGEAP